MDMVGPPHEAITIQSFDDSPSGKVFPRVEIMVAAFDLAMDFPPKANPGKETNGRHDAVQTVIFTHYPAISHWWPPALLLGAALTMFTIPFFTFRRGKEKVILLPLVGVGLAVFGGIALMADQVVSLQYGEKEIVLAYYSGDMIRMPSADFVGLSYSSGMKNTDLFYLHSRERQLQIPYRRGLAREMANFYGLEYRVVTTPGGRTEWWIRPGYPARR